MNDSTDSGGMHIIQDICIENLQQLQGIYSRLKSNFPKHKDYPLWVERQAYWGSIDPLKTTLSFKTEGELRVYILTYADELLKIEEFEVIAMLAKKEQFLS